MTNPSTDWQSLYPFASRYAPVDGGRLHYVDEGSGEAVVMVHGNPTWSFMYRRLIAAGRDHWRAVAVDNMGCGLSDKPQDYSYRLKQHVDNLEHLLDHVLKLDRINLVVHDWGGAIGMGYAVRHPEKIAKLVVMNTAAFLVPHCPWRIRTCRIPGFGALAVRGLNGFARAASRMATAQPGGLPAAVKAGFLAPYDSYRNRIATLRFVQDIPMHPSHPTWETITDIQAKLETLRNIPMLICWGDRDFCFTQPFLDIWEERFPEAEVRHLPEAGHYLLEDAPDTLIPWIMEFIGT